MDMSLSKLRELVMNREDWRAVIHGVTKSWTRLSNRTELNVKLDCLVKIVPAMFLHCQCYYWFLLHTLVIRSESINPAHVQEDEN